MENTDIETKKSQQEKHYFYLEQLQNMATKLPPQISQRLPYTLLSDLAGVLLDEEVFKLIATLKQKQHLNERRMSERRLCLITSNNKRKEQMNQRHKHLLAENPDISLQNDCEQEKEQLNEECFEQLKELDKQIIREQDKELLGKFSSLHRWDDLIDNKIFLVTSEQQRVLEQAGVPGFSFSSDHKELLLQVHLLDFVSRLQRR